MKKQIFFTIIAAALSFTVANAQGGGGGFQRRTVEERVKTIHEKLDSAFNKPGADLMTKIDTIFTNFYKAQDAKRDELMSGGQPDRDVMRAAMLEISNDRDAKLKQILSEAQMKQWKDEIEPSLRPQRGNRPPGGN